MQAFLDGDRDVAARKELALGHVDEARASRTRPASSAAAELIRAAGRALALDPTLIDAADIITTLILEPPPTIPVEVDARMSHADTENARAQGRLAAISLLGNLAFLPLLAWTGIEDMRFVVAFTTAAMIYTRTCSCCRATTTSRSAGST